MDDDSYDELNENGYSGSNMGYNSPSFSNDASNIRNRINASRAEQTNNRRGIAKKSDDESDDEKNSDSGKSSELQKKDGLDEKEGLDKKEGLSNKKDSGPVSGGDKKGGGFGKKVSNLLSKKDNLNFLNKIKAQLNLIKMKVLFYLIVAAVAACILLVVVGFCVGIVSALGGQIEEEEEAAQAEQQTTETVDNGEETTETDETSDDESSDTGNPEIIKPATNEGTIDRGGNRRDTK